MIIHDETSFTLGYGDDLSSFDPREHDIYHGYSPATILTVAPFNAFKELMPISLLAKTKQVHGTEGLVLSDETSVPAPFSRPADYLMTDRPGIGLAIATADCLPVLIYDPRHHAAGIAHVGWRGAAHGIVQKLMHNMYDLYKTDPNNLRVFIGPAAGVCCYEMRDDLIEHFAAYPFFKECLHRTAPTTYLDLTEFVIVSLHELGVPRASCDITHNYCTMCTPRYASHRRQKESARRQLTVVCLKE